MRQRALPHSRPAREFWADVCIWVFVIAAVLSVIGGIALGVELSKETSLADVGPFSPRDEAGHDPAVLASCILGGVFTAALWGGMAVALALLKDISRASRGR